MKSKNALKNLMLYILAKYPHPDDMSNSRLTKTVFLCDWKCCLEIGAGVSGVEWYIDHYGPYVDDVIDLARNDSDFIVLNVQSDFGKNKNLVRLVSGEKHCSGLSGLEEACVDFVIGLTQSKGYDEFINLIYSLYPVVTSSKHGQIDLVKKARDYKALFFE